MPVKRQYKKPHLRVAVAVSTTAAAHAALQKPRKCSTGRWSIAIATFPAMKKGRKCLYGNKLFVQQEIYGCPADIYRRYSGALFLDLPFRYNGNGIKERTYYDGSSSASARRIAV
jgi:hypothetical protein